MFSCRVVFMCKYFQENVRELSVSYYNILRRHNYVTPTSYLELILTFKTLLNAKRHEVDMMRNRYLVGLQKLDFAASQVRFGLGLLAKEYLMMAFFAGSQDLWVTLIP